MDRKAGEPFRATDAKYGTVYRVSNAKEVWDMVQAEQGLVYQTHPRTKGSTGYPDKIFDTDYFRDRIERVIEAMPDAGIGTDIIVGFPGETQRDFEHSIRFVEGLPLSYFHVFPYSVRAGTTAAKLPGKVAAGEIKRRGALMRELGERKREDFAQRWIGNKLKVLLEESTEDGELGGYSRNYVRVLTRGAASQLNQELVVEASFAKGARLVGEIVEVRETPASRAAAVIL